MKRWRWWISSLILIFILLNCGKDKPLPTGYSVIFGDKEGQIADTVIYKQDGNESYYSRLINTGTSANLFLGSYQNYHSAIYMKFTGFPDSANFHSAKLLLVRSPVDSTLSGSSQAFTVAIYPSSFEWKNDEDPEQYLAQLPFDEPAFQTVTVALDSLNNIEIELDTTFVADWADTTSGLSNFGIWIKSPDLEGINSYYSTENTDLALNPQLELIYSITDSAGAIRDTLTLYAINDAFLVPDTAEVLWDLNPDYFYIGKGLAFRSFLKFDLSALDSTVQLNRALLEIVVNKAHSIRNASGASDMILYRKEEDSREKIAVNEAPETSAYTGTLIDSSLTFNVTPTVQGWIGNNYPNYGFLIRSLNEATSIDRVAFYSSKSGAEFQPRLHLYYTLPPKQGF